MTRALAASLALHGTLAAPFFLLRAVPQRSASEQLMVELYGMVADRQTHEQRMSSAPAATLPPQASPRPGVVRQARRTPVQRATAPTPPQPRERQGPSPVQQVLARESVQQPSRQETPNNEIPPSAPTPPVRQEAISGAAVDGDAEVRREQSRLAQRDSEQDRFRQYLARISRKLQSRLVYPEQVNRKALQGASVVRFAIAEDGSIRPATLGIQRSSGYPELDACALDAVRASQPFEPPGRSMNVAVTLSFTASAR